MTGTNHSTHGFPRTNGTRPKARLRLAGLIVTALVGTILIVWVSRNAWDRVDHLQEEFSGLHAESFYLGVRMHSGIRRLNDTLLRYRLRGDPADYDEFHTEANELQAWFENNKTNAVTPLEREFVKQLDKAYQDYLTNSTQVLDAQFRWWKTKAGEFPGSYEAVQSQSQGLLKLCGTFIEKQRRSFDQFLVETRSTLEGFQRLFELTLILLLSLVLALVVLVYRGMIAPLRHQLTESQAIIERQEKLAALGVLAAGLAHEIRNPLTAIRFRLFSLRQALPSPLTDNEDVVVISNEISRLERILKDFLQFARPSEPELVAVPAQRLLEEVGALMKPQLEKASIELRLEPGPPVWVMADVQQLKQVLINLIQNSADSISGNGDVVLRVALEHPPHRDRQGRVALQVNDNGRGIPPDVQKRLFDPFFTTKDRGSGLGLAIAARIVEKHDGEFSYQTEEGHGTTFSIILKQLKEHEPETPAD